MKTVKGKRKNFYCGFYAGAQMPAYLSNYKKEHMENPRTANVHWFKDAWFGMFIHYGLYRQLPDGSVHPEDIETLSNFKNY